MSILHQSPDGWIISHSKYFENISVYLGSEPVQENGVAVGSKTSSGNEYKLLKLDPRLFEIVNPFREAKPKAAKSSSTLTESESISKLEEQFKRLLNAGRSESLFLVLSATKTKTENNTVSRLSANNFYKKAQDITFVANATKFFGSNTNLYSITTKVNDSSFIFPPLTSFYCQDVFDNIDVKLEYEKFDLIILDPPWRNKCIRRRKRKQIEAGYQLMDSVEFGNIPISNISNSNALIVVWCTNAKAHQDQLITEIFPKWDVDYLTTWHWVKVTKSGDPIVPFNSENMKQPYEAIIIGRRRSEQPFSNPDDLMSSKVIISVPSSINSHKPPLVEILKPYLSNGSRSKKCELFARYLVPEFTSIGNEVIKLQHSSLYVPYEIDF